MKETAIGVALCVLAGCASVPAGVSAIATEGEPPAGARLIAPLIVADDAALELRGGELTPDARAEFEKHRADRIRARVEQAATPLPTPLDALRSITFDQMIGCVLAAPVCAGVVVVGVAATPFVLLSGAMANQAMQGLTYVGASIQEPSLRLSSEEAARIAAGLKQRATGAMLVERAMYLAPGAFATGEEARSRLVVRMKTAQTCELEGVAALCLVAEAQGFLADGTELLPTQHVFVQRPLARLAEAGSGHLERTVERAMDLLAASIAADYTGSGPLANLPPEEAAPEPVPAQFGESGRLTDAERAVFPRTSASGCVRDGC